MKIVYDTSSNTPTKPSEVADDLTITFPLTQVTPPDNLITPAFDWQKQEWLDLATSAQISVGQLQTMTGNLTKTVMQSNMQIQALTKRVTELEAK